MHMTDREKLVELLMEKGFGVEGANIAADHLIANGVTFATDKNDGGKWISVTERLPDEYVSVLGHMTDAEPFPEVRECCMIKGEFFFPALSEFHPVDKWTEMP